MSFFTNVTRTKITGIGTASWTTIDLSTFVSVPTGATAAFLCFDTVTTLGTTHGARKVGSADTFTNASLTRLKNYKLIELSGTSVNIDIIGICSANIVQIPRTFYLFICTGHRVCDAVRLVCCGVHSNFILKNNIISL